MTEPKKPILPELSMDDYVRGLVKALGNIETSIAKINENQDSKALEVLNKNLSQSIVTVKGDPGYTPKKGVDYTDGYTPQKGKDYFDGEKGYTPIKGVDYKDGIDGKTPKKGVDFQDGKDGISPTVDYDTIIATVLAKIPDKTLETVKKAVEKIQKGKELSVKDIKDFPNLAEEIRKYTQHLENRGATIVGGGANALLSLIDVDKTGLANGKVPMWDSTAQRFTMQTPSGGGGGHVIQDEGVSLTQRTKLNFIGAGVVATDNAGADSTDITIPGGGSTPTGTGFTHITAGVQDAAAKLVDTADINANQVTNTKLAQMATKTYKGRTTAGTGDPEDVAVATLKTDLVLVKADVGLGNVDNTSDLNKPVSTATQTALNLKEDLTNKSTSTSLGTSNTLYPTQNAVKVYTDSAISTATVGLLDDRGNYDASPNTYPATGGSGTAGAVLKGDLWTISVAGTLGGTAVTVGDVVRALIDTPAQVAANWAIGENNFGYVAENSANKSTTTTLGTSNVLYPTQNAVKVYVDTQDALKENLITGTTSADFWSGAKTFINFATTVRATVLTGLSLATSQVIAATDTVLLSLGYLQAQITALTTTVSNKVASVTAGTNVTITGTATAPIVNATADMVLGTAQTNSALKTFLNGTIGLRNVANTFTALFTNAITATRTYTFKDADGTVAFVSDITGINSGTNTGDQTITLTSDVTGSGTGSFPTTIAAGVVTLAKMANVATGTLFYRKTAGTGSPEVQTLATLKTDLNLTGTNSGDQTTIVGITGTLAQFNTAITDADITPTSRLINTTAPLAGGGDLSADRTLTTSMATNKLIGRGTAGTGVMEEITLGTNLSFTGNTLNAAGGSGGSSGASGYLVYSDGTVPAGNTVANTVAETTFTSQYTLPAGTLAVGDVIRLFVSGVYSTNVVAPTITTKIKIGSVVVATSGAITAIAAVTNGGFTGYCDFIVTNAGASGTGESQGYMEYATAATTALSVNLANTAAISGIDFTTNQTMTMTVQWSAANAANTVTVRQASVYVGKVAGITGAVSYFVDQTPDNGSYGTLVGSVNGSNALFTVAQGRYSVGTLVVYLNGQLQTQGASYDYQETTPGSGTFTFITAPITGDVITAQYQTTTSTTTAVAVTSTEIDFGTAFVKSKRFTINDAGISATSKILVYPNGATATGRVGDDWDWDGIDLAAKARTGSFVLSAVATGYIAGKRKIFYSAS